MAKSVGTKACGWMLAALATAPLLAPVDAVARPGGMGGHGGGHAGGQAVHGVYHGGHGDRGGGYRGGHWGPGVFLGGLGLGLGLGAYYDGYGYGYGYGDGYGYPGYVVGAPVYGVVQAVPPTVVEQAAPVAPSAPDPIFYPRNGQSAAQTEADRRECNRWATTQPNAVSDASVFQRATLACMDAKGYTVR